MNAASSFETGQAGQLDPSDLKQPTPLKMRMKNKRNYIARSTLTLTQSGLLAELLRCERRKVIELTHRHTHRSRRRGFFGNSLTRLLARARSVAAAVQGCVLPRKMYNQSPMWESVRSAVKP